MEQSKAMEYGSRKASPDVLKPRNIYIYIYDIMIIFCCSLISMSYEVEALLITLKLHVIKLELVLHENK